MLNRYAYRHSNGYPSSDTDPDTLCDPDAEPYADSQKEVLNRGDQTRRAARSSPHV